jgi:uncharacterized membrane protein YccC
VSGFVIAVAWGVARGNNPKLGSSLSGWAIGGVVVIGLLLMSSALSDRAQRRRADREAERDTGTIARAEPGATVTTGAEQRAAARIADLEARLAREQQELEAAAASLAASQPAAPGQASPGIDDPVDTESEPELRQEVMQAVTELLARRGSGDAAPPANGEADTPVEEGGT